MSFDDFSETKRDTIRPPNTIEHCKPDYEAQAAKIKKKLDIVIELETALFKFKNNVGSYRFNDISSFAEFIGGLSLQKNSFVTQYNEVLTQIEKEN